MNIHLISGFLGSGKTTAIIHVARLLLSHGLKVGVITNDQGKYLVDTAFFRLANLPAVEVTGGCFCCNFHELEDRFSELIASTQPDVIFAESVGSCADLAATVVRPLNELGSPPVKLSSFSVFTDVRLLRRRLKGEDMPFGDDVVYIFDKQIEEASLLVVNKIDLFSPAALEETARLLEQNYPKKTVVWQSSLEQAGVKPWLDVIQTASLQLLPDGLDIDYTRYGRGEAMMAWLDEEVELYFPKGQGSSCLRQFFTGILQAIEHSQVAIGHLKFIVQSQAGAHKLSFTTLAEPGWEARLPEIEGESASLLVNGRAEVDAQKFSALFDQSLAASGCTYTRRSSAAFHPGFPRPTHRIQ